MREFRRVKIYPEIGPAFYIFVPDEVEDTDLYLDDHLKNVVSWDEAEGGFYAP